MLSFLARRAAAVLLTTFAASVLVFLIVEAAPGSVARRALGMYATEEQVRSLERRLSLDDPLPVRYLRWAGVLVGAIEDPLTDPALGLGVTDARGRRYFGNFGVSILFKEPVNDILWGRLANTGLLAALAFAAIVPLALALGVLAGIREGGPVDLGVSTAGVVAASIPEFASAVFLIAVFVVMLGWLPGASPLLPSPDWPVWTQLVLPVAVLTLAAFGYIARIVRAAMAETMRQPFIRTAVLKGLPMRRVVLGHALRNAMIVPFTVILMQINWLLTGVVVTETVFAYPGFGKLLLEAALFGDIALIEAATLVALLVAAATQIASDIGYALLNPRLRRSA